MDNRQGHLALVDVRPPRLSHSRITGQVKQIVYHLERSSNFPSEPFQCLYDFLISICYHTSYFAAPCYRAGSFPIDYPVVILGGCPQIADVVKLQQFPVGETYARFCEDLDYLWTLFSTKPVPQRKEVIPGYYAMGYPVLAVERRPSASQFRLVIDVIMHKCRSVDYLS